MSNEARGLTNARAIATRAITGPTAIQCWTLRTKFGSIPSTTSPRSPVMYHQVTYPRTVRSPMAPPYRVRAIGSSGCAPSTDATNGTKATPRKNPMLSQTSVRFTRTRKWNVWWWANQNTPRTTKLMTNVKKAARSPTSCVARSALLPSGSRRSSTRSVIAMAKMPSANVSRRPGVPTAVRVPDSIRDAPRLASNGGRSLRLSGSGGPATPIIALHRRAEALPSDPRGFLALRLRELLRAGHRRPPPPAKLELRPAVRERGQHVVGRDVAAIPDSVHVPTVRRTQRDDVPAPEPAVGHLLEVLEHDAPRRPLDDLPLVRLSLETRVLGRVVRAPSEREIERHAERRGDVVFRSPSRPSSPRHHGPLPPMNDDRRSAVRHEDDPHRAHGNRVLDLRDREGGLGALREEQARRARQQDEREPDDQRDFKPVRDGRGTRDAEDPPQERRADDGYHQGDDEARRRFPRVLGLHSQRGHPAPSEQRRREPDRADD